MTREAAKQMFRDDKDAYGKPRSVMRKIDAIYDAIEKQKTTQTSELRKLYKRIVGRDKLHDSDDYFIEEITKIFHDEKE